MLLELIANADVLSDEGQSPLIAAAAQRHHSMMLLLREHGADEDIKVRRLANRSSAISSSLSLLGKVTPQRSKINSALHAFRATWIVSNHDYGLFVIARNL